jgi:enoyl-CoA hydratase/carnithine racemase
MTYERLVVEEDGRIARVWLARPARLNALDGLALEEVIAAFDALSRRDVSVVVLGGHGSSFCAGADRTDPPGRIPPESGAGARARRWAAQLGRRALEAIERCEAVTIARLQGHVIGGGVVLAAACDLRVAAASARFLIPEVELGIPLTWGAVPRLAASVGPTFAKELILLAEPFDGARAERMGFVNRVVPDDELDGVVTAMAGRVAAQPPWAVHMTKVQFRAYGRAHVLGDVTEADGDWLTNATREDPTRFSW